MKTLCEIIFQVRDSGRPASATTLAGRFFARRSLSPYARLCPARSLAAPAITMPPRYANDVQCACGLRSRLRASSEAEFVRLQAHTTHHSAPGSRMAAKKMKGWVVHAPGRRGVLNRGRGGISRRAPVAPAPRYHLHRSGRADAGSSA